MGYESKSLTVTASVSRHNSDVDDAHDLLWEDLQVRINSLVNDEKYEQISPMVF